jgi:hypothetical protein
MFVTADLQTYLIHNLHICFIYPVPNFTIHNGPLVIAIKLKDMEIAQRSYVILYSKQEVLGKT